MDRDEGHILDITRSARLALTYIQDVDQSDFYSDTKLQDSVIRRYRTRSFGDLK